MVRITLVACLAAALSAVGCASPAGTASNQEKQSELSQMEKAGQRNDIDKTFRKSDGGY